MAEQDGPNVQLEKLKLKGGQLVDKIKDLIEEGNARRVILKKDDRVLLEFPLAIGLGGATAAVVFAPTLAAIGAFAALMSDIDVIIEREVASTPELPEEAESQSE